MAKKATTLHDNLGNDLLPVTNASITFMDNGNSVQAEINDLKEKTQYNKGHYTTEQDLLTAYPDNIVNPQSRKGWYAIIGETDSVWIWDIEGNEWKDSGVSSGGVDNVNGLDGEVILTGGNINATATINDTSKTELINKHLTDIYSELDNKVDLNSSQIITGTKVFTETIGLANTSEGTVDQIKHINSNFLITSGTGQNLLNIDEGLETISAFNRELAYEDDIQQIQGDYATKDELSQEIQNVTDMIPTKVSELTNDSNYATVSQVNANTTLINTINSKIPNQASSTNQLADRDFVNSSLNSITAFYITSNAYGNPFSTKSALTSATTYYSGGQVATPTRNDYAIVLQDETKDNATTRYIYYNQWEYQYTVNETALTADQLSAINSGITSTLVGKISSNELMINSLAEQVVNDYAKKSELPDTSNFVTLSGVQTITGGKKFTSGIGASIIQDVNNNTMITRTSDVTVVGDVDFDLYLTSKSRPTINENGVGKDLAYLTDIPIVPNVPTDNSQLTNGAGYVKSSELLNIIYPIGSIFITTSTSPLGTSSPASWLGGTWTQLKDRFLIGAGGSYSNGSTGGVSSHTHGLTNGYAKINYGWIDSANKLVLQQKQATWTGGLKTRDSMNGYEFPTYTENYATELGGSTDSASNIPPYLAVYMWKRTA